MPAALELVPGSLGFPALGVKHSTGPAFFSPICSKVPCCLAREALQGARGQRSLSCAQTLSDSFAHLAAPTNLGLLSKGSPAPALAAAGEQ